MCRERVAEGAEHTLDAPIQVRPRGAERDLPSTRAITELRNSAFHYTRHAGRTVPVFASDKTARIIPVDERMLGPAANRLD